MKKQQLSKLMALTGAVMLAAALPMTALAETGDVTNVAVSGAESETVDGDVSKHDAGYGIEMTDKGNEKVSGTVTVNGSVSVGDTAVTDNPSYNEVQGIVIDSDYGGKGTVNVTGNVNAKASLDNCQYGSDAAGVYTNTNADINIGGNVESTGVTISYGINYAYSYSPDSSEYSATTNVDGNVEVSATGKSGFAAGIKAMDKSTDKTTVDGDVKVSGANARGISITNPWSYDSGKGKTSEVVVRGNVEADGTTSGIGIYVEDNLKNVDITVDGDIKGSSNGIYVVNSMSDVKIKTDGTISSTNGAAIAVVAKTKETINKEAGGTTDIAADVIPDITVWKIESGSGNLVAAKVTDDDSKTEAFKNYVLSSINYIIKGSVTEDGKDTSNGKLVLKGTSGTVTIGDKTYDTAHQDETITINVETVKGYNYTLSDGQAVLTANPDGTYTIKVPEGGGVELKAVLEKIVQKHYSSNYDSSGSSNDSSTSSATAATTATAATATAATATVAGVTESTVPTTTALANGTSATVLGAIIATDGSVSGGLVSSGTAAAATGEAKRAGLPDAVVSTLDAIDAGNLANIPQAAGKSVLAQTVAIVSVTPGAQQQLIMAAGKIPASGVVQVVFYNNVTGQFLVLPASVDPATGIVTFAAPGDGTAAIIG